jgi:hypothetical protein
MIVCVRPHILPLCVDHEETSECFFLTTFSRFERGEWRVERRFVRFGFWRSTLITHKDIRT